MNEAARRREIQAIFLIAGDPLYSSHLQVRQHQFHTESRDLRDGLRGDLNYTVELRLAGYAEGECAGDLASRRRHTGDGDLRGLTGIDARWSAQVALMAGCEELTVTFTS